MASTARRASPARPHSIDTPAPAWAAAHRVVAVAAVAADHRVSRLRNGGAANARRPDGSPGRPTSRTSPGRPPLSSTPTLPHAARDALARRANSRRRTSSTFPSLIRLTKTGCTTLRSCQCMARSGVVTARMPNPRCSGGKERSGGEERSGGVVVVARVWRRLPRPALGHASWP